MMWFLRRLFGMCDHKWRVVKQGDIVRDGNRIGSFYDLACERCGAMKVVNLK